VEVESFEIIKDSYNPNKPSYRVSFTDLNGGTYYNVKLVIKASESEKDEMVGEYEKEHENERFFLRISLAREWNNGQWEQDMCALQVSCFASFEDEVVVNV
jgi:hypothetical protein